MNLEILGLKLKNLWRCLPLKDRGRDVSQELYVVSPTFYIRISSFWKAMWENGGIFVYVILYPGDVIGKFIVTMLGKSFVLPHIKFSIWKRMQWSSCEISKQIKTWNRSFEKCTNAMGRPTSYQFYSSFALYWNFPVRRIGCNWKMKNK